MRGGHELLKEVISTMIEKIRVVVCIDNKDYAYSLYASNRSLKKRMEHDHTILLSIDKKDCNTIEKYLDIGYFWNPSIISKGGRT
jgi:hypothetical protein